MKTQTSAILIICLLINLLPAFSGKADKISGKQLLEAPEKIVLEQQEITFSAYLWRDFMPNSPADGKPMRAAIQIFATDNSPLASNFSAEEIWVIDDKNIWNEKLQPAGRGLPPMGLQTYEATAGNGPKWTPGKKVTVIVQIKTADGGKLLIRKADQLIEKTL